MDVVPCWGCVWGCSVGQHPLLAWDVIPCWHRTPSPVALSLTVSVLLRCRRPAGLVAWERVHTNPALLLPAPSFGRGEAEPLLSKAVFLFVIFLLSFFSFSLEIKSKRKEESQPFPTLLLLLLISAASQASSGKHNFLCVTSGTEIFSMATRPAAGSAGLWDACKAPGVAGSRGDVGTWRGDAVWFSTPGRCRTQHPWGAAIGRWAPRFWQKNLWCPANSELGRLWGQQLARG